MLDHEVRVAIGTGGRSGIGRGASLALARQGSSVVVHGLHAQEADEVAELIRSEGGRAIATSGPIEDPATSARAVDAAIAEFGRLDTLATSAGIQRYAVVLSTPESE